MQHRGRFQAQGDILEESESWAQELPLLLTDGQDLLKILEGKLSRKDLLVRAKGFAKCRQVMESASKSGGINVADMGKIFIKSYPQNHIERVDLEVHLGIAFILKKKNDETSE